MGCVRRVRNTLLAQSNAGDVGIDYAKKVAYIAPSGEFDIDAAIEGLKEAGYEAIVQP
ncbi:MAG: hypothetical protein MK209_04475 [Planctomycetes bacterium]|nr:hypothetical protein [Planctomycetota bacterium]